MTYTATIINHGGYIPYIDCRNNNATVTTEMLDEYADNAGAANKYGANHLVIAAYPNAWHVAQVGGYNRFDGLFCELH